MLRREPVIGQYHWYVQSTTDDFAVEMIGFKIAGDEGATVVVQADETVSVLMRQGMPTTAQLTIGLDLNGQVVTGRVAMKGRHGFPYCQVICRWAGEIGGNTVNNRL